jgi:hypothetical protein
MQHKQEIFKKENQDHSCAAQILNTWASPRHALNSTLTLVK